MNRENQVIECWLRVAFTLPALLISIFNLAAAQAFQDTTKISDWQVSIDGGQTFQPISVPGTVERQINADFDGVSIYVTSLKTGDLREGMAAILRFQAVATAARVFINGKLSGEHLGGWTPFEIDISDPYRAAAGKPLEMRVEVDERVGHNTQGFLPVVTNHFSGIWQPVTLKVVNRIRIDEDRLFVHADWQTRKLHFEVPIVDFDQREMLWRIFWVKKPQCAFAAPVMNVSVKLPSDENQQSTLSLVADMPDEIGPWSPQDPALFEFTILGDSTKPTQALGEESVSTVTAKLCTGFRDFQVAGDQFQLNGSPISLRGVLNWGYAPPDYGPSLDPDFMRKEIRFAKVRGFNLMKFCLWIPPKEYLKLCDEEGMLVWIEYPTWHPQLDEQHLEELRTEYQEFFEYDRQHPCVILRSLTCETGPSADINVVRSLYEQCKSVIPGAVVEDDSSWIEWNRVHDFYDDHPYGNNHTWRDTLRRLKTYILEHEQQPLILGEAIAADSWTVPDDFSLNIENDSPGNGPWSLDAAEAWIDWIQALAQAQGRVFEADELREQSLHYGQLMRKFQIEAYRGDVPNGGYVVSVIRDFPKAAMGMIDYFNQPKLPPECWQFHGDDMLLLETPNDHRSFWSGGEIDLVLKTTRSEGFVGDLRLELVDLEGISTELIAEAEHLNEEGESKRSRAIAVRFPEVDRPQRFLLRATTGQRPAFLVRNEWPVWVFPKPDSAQPTLHVHPSAGTWAGESGLDAKPWTAELSGDGQPRMILTSVLDGPLLKAIENGSRIVFIPNNEKGSFPTTDHWFLRGAPVVLAEPDQDWHLPFSADLGSGPSTQNALVELQHFDLAGPVVPQIDAYLEQTIPWIVLWDNHDLREVRTHGLAFEMEVGDQGRLFVSALNHSGDGNAVGQWLLRQWLDRLDINRTLETVQPIAVRKAVLDQLKSEILNREIDLTQAKWRFQPDPREVGRNNAWASPTFDDSDWQTLGIHAHWEGQGFEALDHWAWYRIQVDIPSDWHAPQTFLNFTGIDDYADVYVNGERIASVGDIEKRETAFETRISLDISQQVAKSRSLTIAVAVYDWYGAGGIFRPVTLTTRPIDSEPPILK